MRAALIALAASTAALAQTTASSFITLDIAGNSKTTIGGASCGSTLTVSWSAAAPLGAFVCKSMDIWTTDGDCGDSPTGNYKSYGPVDSARFTPTGSGTVTVSVKDLPGLNNSTDGGNACGQGQFTKDFHVCAAYTLGGTLGCSSSPQVVRASPLTIAYDSKPPAAPVITEVAAQDGKLGLTLTVDSDTSLLRFLAKGPGDAEFTERGTAPGTVTSPTVGPLENGVTYQVVVVAEDAAGNQSVASNVGEGTPVHTDGWYPIYRKAGGREQGGCAAAPGAALAAALLALCALGSRARKRS